MLYPVIQLMPDAEVSALIDSLRGLLKAIDEAGA